ncbi:DUF4352 domain-containing protein [Nonomuraea rubra]
MSQPYGHDPYGQQPPSQPYPPQPGYGYPPPPRKKSSAPIVLVVIAGLALLLFGGCAVIVAAVGSAGDGTPTSATLAEEEPAPEAAEAQEAEETEETEETGDQEEKQAGIGATVRDGQFSFKVTGTEKRDRVGSDFLGAEAQGVYLLVHVTVKNIGDEAGSFFGANQKLYDAKGREYEASSEAAIYLDDSKSLYEKINPGNSVKGIVLFDIPKNVKPASIELHDSLFSAGVTVSLTGANS